MTITARTLPSFMAATPASSVACVARSRTAAIDLSAASASEAGE